MAEHRATRRSFLAALIFGAAVVPLARYLTPRKEARRKVLFRVAPGEIPAEGALVYREERVALLRQGEGYLALSLVCTHLGCTVVVGADGLSCPCHGSRFDRQGRVLHGPADRPLRPLPVALRGGLVEVYSA